MKNKIKKFMKIKINVRINMLDLGMCQEYLKCTKKVAGNSKVVSWKG